MFVIQCMVEGGEAAQLDSETRGILSALLEGQRVAEAERIADRALLKGIIAQLNEHSAEFKAVNAKLGEHSAEFKAVNAKLKEHSAEFKAVNAKLKEHSAEFKAVNAKLNELGEEVIGLRKQVGELSARDRHFMHKLGEHDTEIAVLQQQLKAK